MVDNTTIDVGFNTDQLKDAVSGGIGGGAGGAQNQKNNIAGGFTTALKGAGVLAILSQLKVVMESISFVLNIISSLISFIVVKMIQSVFKFFEDPVRGLLGLGIFIVNGIIENINNVVKAINALIPGTRGDIPLIPELDPEEILAAYDAAKEAARLAAQGITDSAGSLETTIVEGVNGMEEKVKNSFNAYENVMDLIIKKSSEFVSSGGRTSGVFTSGNDTYSNLVNFGTRSSQSVDQKRQDANKAYKYLTTGA